MAVAVVVVAVAVAVAVGKRDRGYGKLAAGGGMMGSEIAVLWRFFEQEGESADFFL